MGRLRDILVGLSLGFLIAGCAGATFAYKYYGIDGVRYDQGKLLGPKPENDIPFDRCQPTSQVKTPCIVMFTGEFLKLKQDYMDTQNKLQSCEAGQLQAARAD